MGLKTSFTVLTFFLLLPVLLAGNQKNSSGVWIGSSLEVAPSDIDFNSHTAKLVLAKGEFESFQLALEVDSLQPLMLERITGNDLLKVQWYERVPFDGVEGTLVPSKHSLFPKNKLVKLWFTYEADREIPAGNYSEKWIFKNAGQSQTIDVNIEVKNIEIPITPSIPITFGIYQKAIVKSDDSTVFIPKREEYFELLFDHRISPYLVNWGPPNFRLEVQSSPYDWEDARTMNYVKDPRFAAIALPYWGKTDEELKALYGKVEQAGMLDKAYVYFIDEPHTIAKHDKLLEGVKRIHQISPTLKINVPFYCGLESSSQNIFDVFERYKDYPMIFNTSNWALQNNEVRSQQCANSIKEGQEWWTYICCGQRPGFTHNTNAIGVRSLLWRSWKEGSTGFLYWAVNDYHGVDPLVMNPHLKPGDGSLVYPGSAFGVEQPALSVRLECFRDGAEDYELLLMYEKKYGREATLELLQKVYHGPRKQTSDAQQVENFRLMLLNGL